jgi:chemotaxis regulatin CheY-phosphate phosphatase CheZ
LMDEAVVALIGVVIAQNFYLIKEVYSLKREFKNHMRYLHVDPRPSHGKVQRR